MRQKLADMSKRKWTPGPHTLWLAAKVKGHGNLATYFRNHTAVRRLVDAPRPGVGLDIDDFRESQKVKDHAEKVAKDKDKREGDIAKYNDKKASGAKRVKRVKPAVMSTCVVGLKPTKAQKEVLEVMLRVSNTAYNWCAWLVKEHGVEPNYKTLQKYVATTERYPRPLNNGRGLSGGVKDDLVDPRAEWLFAEKVGMTQHRLTAAVKYAAMHKAAHTNWENKGSRPESKPHMRPRPTSAIPCGSFGVQKLHMHTPTTKELEKAGLTNGRVHRTILPGIFTKQGAQPLMRLRKPLKVPVNQDCAISKRVNGKWNLNVPCPAELIRAPPPTHPLTKLAGVDPGVADMVTVYDATDHDGWEMGLASDAQRLEPKMARARRLEAASSEARKKGHHQEADSASIGARRIRLRIKNKITSIHDVFKHHMVTNFAFVALGDINVKSIVRNKSAEERAAGRHGLSSAGKDKMYLWSHYRLKEALKHRAQGTDCNYVIQDEAYTTKTCGQCDSVKTMTLADRTYNCKHCGYVCHRDLNAARNILRRSLGVWTPNTTH